MEEIDYSSYTPFTNAQIWLTGSGSYIGAKNYQECVDYIQRINACDLETAQRAVSMAIKACGMYPSGFEPPFFPKFRSHQIAVGDIVYGGRIVYDEYVAMHGRVVRVEKWYAGGEPRYSIYIYGKFAGYEGEEDISLDSIYRVEKPAPKEEDDFSCHYCGMPAKSFGFFEEPVCEECGG
jgi:hypothetical protein